jgi:hypothetical protein
MPVKGVDQGKGNRNPLACPLLFFYRPSSSPSSSLRGQLGHYLAGLIEADGCIVVPTKERTPKGRKTYPSIQIVFNINDYPLAVLKSN